MEESTQKSCINRLSRIEGQVRGISRMVEDKRYCIDIITQIQAVSAALRKVEDEVLKDHVNHCVEGAIRSGDQERQRELTEELLRVMQQRTK